MFSPRTRPLALDAERLLGLRLSLNTPVVATPELPAGPARAALVSHREVGMRRITVALRSLRNGATVLYELEGESLDTTLDFTVAVEAALSFAESMGFLFDDDELGAAGAEGALGRWRELIAPSSEQAHAPGVGPPALAPELLLDELAEELPDPEALGAGPAGAAGASQPAPARAGSPAPRSAAPVATPAPAVSAGAAPARPVATLTKFRAPGDGIPPEPGPGAPDPPAPQSPRAGKRAAPLGRMRLVRRAEPAASALLRLLSSF